MIRPLRRVHRAIVLLLALAVPIVLALALRARPVFPETTEPLRPTARSDASAPPRLRDERRPAPDVRPATSARKAASPEEPR